MGVALQTLHRKAQLICSFAETRAQVGNRVPTPPACKCAEHSCWPTSLAASRMPLTMAKMISNARCRRYNACQKLTILSAS